MKKFRNFTLQANLHRILSSQTPSFVIINQEAHSTTTAALETRSTTANFAQKDKNSPISSLKTTKTPAPSIAEPTNDVSQVYSSSKSPNDNILRHSTLSTSASSLQDSQGPASSGHEKGTLSQAIFESRPTTSFFRRKPGKSPIPANSTRPSWADDASELPTSIAPTKQARDLSSFRSPSSSNNPFSSLQHRHRKFNKKRPHVLNSEFQCCCHHHTCSGPYHHSQKPHYHSQSPFSISLNWDQEPLADLSNALRALGWVRR